MKQEGGEDQSSGRKMNIVVGPWGGNGGADWDDGSSYNGVREIKLVNSFMTVASTPSVWCTIRMVDLLLQKSMEV
ncbi:hypothetical protein LguiA_009988 [Lonicera macranthoides]